MDEFKKIPSGVEKNREITNLQTSGIGTNRNIEFINGSAFLKNNISEKFELDTFQYQENLVTFIDKFKPEFCIVEGNVSIPQYIKPFLEGESIMGSNEKTYLLKYYED